MRALSLLCLLLVACDPEEAQSDEIIEDTNVEEPDPDDTGDIVEEGDVERGREIHDQVCMTCHYGNPLFPQRVPEMTDAQLRRQIVDGGDRMPAQDLDDTEVDDVIAFLRVQYGGPE